ncbi:MAG: hypothetical protein ABJP48_00030 [Erythrobacter sp.]
MNVIEAYKYIAEIMTNPSKLNGRDTNLLLNSMYRGVGIERLPELLGHEDKRIRLAGGFILFELNPENFLHLNHFWIDAMASEDPSLQYDSAKSILDHEAFRPCYLEGMMRLRQSDVSLIREVAEDWIQEYSQHKSANV